ncbi:MAG: hypothetical protein KKA42_05790 [candidate division Zixibacteria bacterium]|nr:hypothetical protein [candidate division Zixibacteria bacterium]
MPFSHTISAPEKLARVRAEGPVNLDACIKAIEALASDPEFSKDFKIIVDLRKMDYDPSNTDVQGLASFLGARCSSFQERTAVVVPPRLLGVARIVTVLAEVAGFRMKMFTDYDGAVGWLGIGKPRDINA